jgi:outer membrane immunogenic protein
MKKVLLASVAVGALFAANGAQSADLAARPVYKAPVAVPLPAPSWTGCYVGLQVGGGWGRNKITQTENSVTPGASSAPTVVVNRASTGNIDTSGAVAGGQVGCDYQFSSNWVIGLQGALLWSGISGTGPDPHDPTDTLGVKTRWLSSVTGRFGYAGLLPNTLLYAKGGAAWANYRFDLQSADLSFGVPSVDQTRSGWTVGAGLEWMFARNWSVFVEYNHYDFGGGNVAAFSPILCVGCTATNTISSISKVDTVTAGVNYHFTWANPPVTARY